MVADGENERPGSYPGWRVVPVPDPTTLTTEAVERATQVFRRELQSLRETLETRLDAADAERNQTRDRIREIVTERELVMNHMRDEMIHRDQHTREVITQRLNDLDTAFERGRRPY